MTSIEHRIEWLPRQMYSRKRPIGRDQVMAAFTAVLKALTGEEVDVPEKIAEQELSDCKELGYWAATLTYRVKSRGPSGAALVLVIDPIPGSMGVSGEHQSWRSENLADGVSVSGTALSHAILPSHALLRLDGVAAAQAQAAIEKFTRAFPKVMTAAELSKELGK